MRMGVIPNRHTVHPKCKRMRRKCPPRPAAMQVAMQRTNTHDIESSKVRAASTIARTLTELIGISSAAASGVIHPVIAKPTATKVVTK